MIPEEQLEKFQTLYKERFGKEISKEEAYEKGIKLIRVVELLHKPRAEDGVKQENSSEKNEN